MPETRSPSVYAPSMGTRGWRRWTIALVIGLLAPFVVPEALQPASAAGLCGPSDRPETGIAGDVPLPDQITGRAAEGYSCGLSLVGYSSLGGRGGNANMAWSGDCAYVAGDGVAVVDVRDPQHPRHIRTLHGAGADAALETIATIEAPGRTLLATGRYGFYGTRDAAVTAPVDIWDVADCRHPKRLLTVKFPGNVHNLTFSADGRTLWSTLPLQAMDLSNLRRPRILPHIEQDLAASGHPSHFYAHEAWPSPDGTRLYVGGQLPLFEEELLVIDIEHWPAQPARVIGSVPRPGHSVRPMTIKGKPYLLASDESILNPTAKGCLPDVLTPVGGASYPALIDLSNERLPKVRGKIRLPINEPIHCAEQVLSGVNASVHYHDVDDPDDTTFALVSAWNAGLRIFDVRNPARPREVAYFNPGMFAPLAGSQSGALDQAWAHSRYVRETGHIWLTTSTGGFWVLELQPQVRKALDLPARPTLHPKGTAPRPAASRIAPIAASSTTAAAYCAISTARIL